MLRRYIKIDGDGFYHSEVLVAVAATVDLDGDPITPQTHIEDIPADGFVRPRRVTGAWVEGGTFDLVHAQQQKILDTQAELERRLGFGLRLEQPSTFCQATRRNARCLTAWLFASPAGVCFRWPGWLCMSATATA